MSTTNRQRGSYSKSAELRRRIVDVAIEVFAQQGFRGGSLREIGDRVGMTPAGLLHHFGTKDALLVEVLRRHEELQPVAGHEVGLSGHVSSMRQIMANKLSAPGLTHLFVTLSAEATDPGHPAHAYFVDRYERTGREFVEVLTRARDAGEIANDVNVQELSRLAIAVLDGLQLQWLLNRNFDMTGAFDLFLSSLKPLNNATDAS